MIFATIGGASERSGSARAYLKKKVDDKAISLKFQTFYSALLASWDSKTAQYHHEPTEENAGLDF